MKKTIILVAISLIFGVLNAQEESEQPKDESNVSLNIALKNRHLWRCGQGIDGFSAQSTLSYNLPFMSIGAWGAYELAPSSYCEVDLFMEFYILDYFTLGLYDFYFPQDQGGRLLKDFRDYKSSPNHAIDAFVKYSGVEAFPLGALAGAYVYGGADRDANGNQKYSTYLELNYSWNLTPTRDLFFYVGATTSNTSAYASKKPIYQIDSLTNENVLVGYGPATEADFNIIGVGTKYTRSFKIGKFDANASGEFLYNPNVDAVYMAFYTSITF